MPHNRNRFVLSRLKEKLKFARVVTVQGARQTGKSFMVKELFKQGTYTTLDKIVKKRMHKKD